VYLISTENICAEVHDSITASLVFIEPAKNSDKYYIVQIIKHKATHEFYVFSRWGRTGTGGQAQVLSLYQPPAADTRSMFLHKTPNNSMRYYQIPSNTRAILSTHTFPLCTEASRG
jgi:predicted DNA-binding WGR domain protein